ncbi:MAG: ATP-binding protein [Phycisphaerales bacterium]
MVVTMVLVSANTIAMILVDDDESHRNLLERAIKQAFEGSEWVIEVHAYSDADSALVELPADQLSMVFIDNHLDGTRGIDWISDFVRHGSGPVVLMTSSGDETTAAEAFRRGAADYITKSDLFDHSLNLRRCVDEAIRRFKLTKRNVELSNRLKISNGDLERQNHRLQDITATAHQFVDDVAHEFRTPLAVIREFASIISDGIGGDVTDKQSQYLAYIVDATRDLSILIDDFLDSSKLRANSLRVERVGCMPKELFEPIVPLLETRAAIKNIEIEWSYAEDLPSVYVDIDKARRSLINLVVNAVKFSPESSVIRIAVEMSGFSEISVSVHDQGPGLAPDAVEAMFKRFQQASNGKYCEAKGFGLGLSIVKQLVAINFGEVRIKSVLGEGSDFTFTLLVNSPDAIVQGLAKSLIQDDSKRSIGAIRIRPIDDKLTVERLVKLIGSVCQPHDIVIESPEGDGVLAIGSTDNPDYWRDRLLAIQHGESVGALPLDTGGIRVEVLGRWPIQSASAPLYKLLSSSE